MHLSQFDHELLKRAIGVYLQLAYQERERPDELDYSPPRFTDLFHQFLDEGQEEAGRRLARYALRLGNDRYPFMKLVLQEFVRAGDFYFSVDTHDEMNIAPETPGYEEFQGIRAFNRALKERIEEAWAGQGLPTLYRLKEALAGAAVPRAADVAPRAQLLVVDDDPDLAGVMEAILQKHGYDVTLARSGEGALEAVQGAVFDLIICDYQMPGMDGAILCDALRRRADTRFVPVLLTTAAPVSLAEITDKANGFLVKPYREEVLIGLIDNLLDRGRG